MHGIDPIVSQETVWETFVNTACAVSVPEEPSITPSDNDFDDEDDLPLSRFQIAKRQKLTLKNRKQTILGNHCT